MILKYMLPKSYEDRIILSKDSLDKVDLGNTPGNALIERIYYSVPVDIDSNGKWTSSSFFVVTTKKIYENNSCGGCEITKKNRENS